MIANDLSRIHRLVWCALMAALTAVGAFLHVPLGPVPISLQTLFVFLSGLVLGPAYGAAAMALYVAAGVLGLPIFTGGKSGLGVILGPTGGFLFGFIACAFACGVAGKRFRAMRASGALGSIWGRGLCLLLMVLPGLALLYVLGVPYLSLVLDIPLSKALAVGMYPFLPGATMKLVAAVAAYLFLEKRELLPA